MIEVCNIQVMKPLLAEHGFHFSKAKGQNFLIAPWVPQSIATDAGVDETAGVLEIGPGIGPLTQQLCLRAKKVCAVELDKRLQPILEKTVGEFSNLEIIWDDVLNQNVPALVAEKFHGLRPMACANLPYYITSPILTALLEADCFESVTVMVQKEVAQRIAAAPGSEDYSAFTVFCQYYAEPKLLFDVPAHCFMPQPKVTSAVIQLRFARSAIGALMTKRFSSALSVPALPCAARSFLTALPPASRSWARMGRRRLSRRQASMPTSAARLCPSRISPGSPTRSQSA